MTSFQWQITKSIIYNSFHHRIIPGGREIFSDSSTSFCRVRFGGGGGGGGGDDGLGIGCPLLNVAGLLSEDNMPIGNRVEGGGAGEGEIMVCFQIH